MTPPTIEELLEARAERGVPRGPEILLDRARSAGPEPLATLPEVSAPQSPRPRAPYVLLAAAVLLVLAAVIGPWLLRSDSETTVAVEGAPAPACAAEPAGVLVDDPGGLFCPTAEPASTVGAEVSDVFVVGDVGAALAATKDGGFVVEIAPRPNDAGPVSLPPDGASGGVLVRSNMATSFADGSFQVDAGVFLGHDDYQNSARDPGVSFELVVTTAPEPDLDGTGLFADERFEGAPVIGCRLDLETVSTCSLIDSGGTEVWQTNFFSPLGGEQPFGGFETDSLRFTRCTATGQFAECVDSVAMQIAPGSIRLLLNGEVFFEQVGLPPLPSDLLDAEVYSYWAVLTNRSELELLRFHGWLGAR